MASDDTLTIQFHSSSMPEDEEDEDDEDDHHHHHHHPNNLSRLSICTTNSSKHSIYENDEDDVVSGGGDMSMFMSLLSIEGSDRDADEELSDEKVGKEVSGEWSDSDKEPAGCLSLPATPPRQRRRRGCVNQEAMVKLKEYASENEVENKTRRIRRERWLERAWEEKKKKKKKWKAMDDDGGGGCLRPINGGRRSSFSSSPLCLDLEEVKACRDLGFQLEHDTRISLSCSTLDTSSSGNSPISSWRISSPGDDPRDIKARLKVWAQAVALASTSHLVD